MSKKRDLVKYLDSRVSTLTKELNKAVKEQDIEVEEEKRIRLSEVNNIAANFGIKIKLPN